MAEMPEPQNGFSYQATVRFALYTYRNYTFARVLKEGQEPLTEEQFTEFVEVQKGLVGYDEYVPDSEAELVNRLVETGLIYVKAVAYAPGLVVEGQ